MTDFDKLRPIITQISIVRDELEQTADCLWSDDRRNGWLVALESIEKFLAGDDEEKGFSIIRSLDSQDAALFDTPPGAALVSLSRLLNGAGIERYR